MQRERAKPSGTHLPKDGQALLDQAGCSGRLTLPEGDHGCDPGGHRTPVPGAQLINEILTLLEPLADGRRIALRKPEPEGRMDEGTTDHELVACFAKEPQRLLKEGLPPGVLTVHAELIRQMDEGIGDFPRPAYLPHQSHPLLIKRERLSRLAPRPGDASEQEEGSGNAACLIQFSA